MWMAWAHTQWSSDHLTHWKKNCNIFNAWKVFLYSHWIVERSTLVKSIFRKSLELNIENSCLIHFVFNMKRKQELISWEDKTRNTFMIKNNVYNKIKMNFYGQVCKPNFMVICLLLLALKSSTCLCAEDQGKILKHLKYKKVF